MPRRVPIVVNINVLVDAVVAEPDPERWESPPLVRGEASAMTLAILNEGLEFELWLSKHLIEGTTRVLRRAFHFTSGEAAAYSAFLRGVTSRAGGVIETTVRITRMRGLGGQPGLRAGRNNRCLPNRQFGRSSPFDVPVAWNSNSIARSFRFTCRCHAALLSERLLATKPDSVAVRVTEITARQHRQCSASVLQMFHPAGQRGTSAHSMQFPMASSEVLAAAAAEVPVEVAQQTEVRSTLQCFRVNVQDQVQNAAFCVLAGRAAESASQICV